MPIYNHTGKRQFCSKCGWKNPMIEHSDCLVFYHKECPECKSELHWQKVNEVQDKLEAFLKIFKL